MSGTNWAAVLGVKWVEENWKTSGCGSDDNFLTEPRFYR